MTDPMADMEGLFPQGGPVSKEALRRHLPGPVFNVQGFGAKGDGAADDTNAIQATIDAAGRAGGGIVYLPAGIYCVQPQASIAADRRRANALQIAWDNVTLRGDGAALTKLLFRALGGGDPTTQYELQPWHTASRRTVWRGSAVLIVGGETEAAARRNVTIENLAIDGGVRPGYTGERRESAGGDAPDGWDISHKGIYLQEDLHYRRIVVRNVHAHDFRGEIIYGGGPYIDDVLIEGCELHGTNGDCISVSASQIVRDNHLYDAAHAGVESFHYAKEARYLNNRIERARLGINIQTAWDSPFPAIVSGNTFWECSEYGILLNVENGTTFISDNTFVDCGYGQTYHASILLRPGKGMARQIINGVTIRNNTLLRQVKDGGVGIFIGCEAGYKLKSIVISENFIGSSGPAIDRNLRFLSPIAYSYIKGAEVDGVFISKNIFFRTQRHVENTSAHLPELGGPMPLMWDNQAIGFNDAANTTVLSDGAKPVRLQNEGPVSLQNNGRGAEEMTPKLTPADYSQGQKLTLTNANGGRQVYIPQSSDIYECRVGRYLLPGVYLTLMRDGAKLREVAFEDRREHHYAEVKDGNILAADGFEEVYLSVPSERRFTSFSGIGHGAQVRIIATNANVTIAHGGGISLHANSDYAMRENEVKLFMRTRDGILREI